jgi:hypothetical protein|tara:strand:- start:2059 stop:2472 length:414 start_codon:yes stop_codon:yes gene_type:complete
MDENYNELVRKSEKFKSTRDEKYKEVSKDRLLKISQKKIQTTMIGALSTIEKYFGFLWGHEGNGELTPEQTHMKEQFDEVRAEILDRGNNQIRNLEAEFTNYDISWLRYRMTLPVKPVTTEPEINQGEEDGQKQEEN